MTKAETKAVHKALTDLEDKNGRLTPEGVVRAASDPDSPLHEHFQWDDSEAAKSWRLQQARCLIHSVTVTVTVDEKNVSTVHYVRDPTVAPDVQGYVAVERLQREPENVRPMLEYELGHVEARLNRAVSLADAFGLGPQVKRVARRVLNLRRQVTKLQPRA